MQPLLSIMDMKPDHNTSQQRARCSTLYDDGTMNFRNVTCPCTAAVHLQACRGIASRVALVLNSCPGNPWCCFKVFVMNHKLRRTYLVRRQVALSEKTKADGARMDVMEAHIAKKADAAALDALRLQMAMGAARAAVAGGGSGRDTSPPGEETHMVCVLCCTCVASCNLQLCAVRRTCCAVSP